MMLKRYLLGISQIFYKESRKKKKPEVVSRDADSNSSSVRIVHAGGVIELYHGAIPVEHVLKKYPRFCVARPEVFKRPCESEVGPEEKLLPGQKFYLVPRTTMKKLRLRHGGVQEGEDSQDLTVWSGSISLSETETESGEDAGEDSESCGYSAKDFYVSREKWTKCFLRRCGILGYAEEKPFMPPIKKVMIWERPGWEPSLTSIEELSP